MICQNAIHWWSHPLFPTTVCKTEAIVTWETMLYHVFYAIYAQGYPILRDVTAGFKWEKKRRFYIKNEYLPCPGGGIFLLSYLEWLYYWSQGFKKMEINLQISLNLGFKAALNLQNITSAINTTCCLRGDIKRKEFEQKNCVCPCAGDRLDSLQASVSRMFHRNCIVKFTIWVDLIGAESNMWWSTWGIELS